MTTVRLVNTNPLGAVDLPLLGRALDALEEFDCPEHLAGRGPSLDADGLPDLGEGLLAQVGNYRLADKKLAAEAAKDADAVTAAHSAAVVVSEPIPEPVPVDGPPVVTTEKG